MVLHNSGCVIKMRDDSRKCARCGSTKLSYGERAKMKEETYLSGNTKHLRDVFDKSEFDFGDILDQAELQDVSIIKIVFLKRRRKINEQKNSNERHKKNT